MLARMTSPRPQDLATDLRVAAMRMSRRLRAETSAPVTEAQYSVLALLLHEGPMSPGELAERECVQAPSMTRTVAALEMAGLVARARHATDGRQVVLTITPTGRDVVEETRRRRNAWLNDRLDRLDAAERQTMGDAVAILLRIMEG